MLIVDTNIEVASKPATSLQVMTPSGQNLTAISTNENGIVKKHKNRSEMAKFSINIFLSVLIAGFLATAMHTNPLPIAPAIIKITYAMTNPMSQFSSIALLFNNSSNRLKTSAS